MTILSPTTRWRPWRCRRPLNKRSGACRRTPAWAARAGSERRANSWSRPTLPKPRHDLRSTSASLSRLAKPGPPYALTCPPERPLSLDQKRPRVLRTSVVRHSWLGRLASGLPSRYNSSPHFTNALDDGLSLTAGKALSRARYGLGCPVRSRLRDGMAQAPAGRLP